MTPSRIRESVIVAKAATVRDMLAAIETLPLASPEDFAADRRMVGAGESFLRRGLEALLDIGRHVLARGFGVPAVEYKEIARTLGEHGVLAPAETERLTRMAGLPQPTSALLRRSVRRGAVRDPHPPPGRDRRRPRDHRGLAGRSPRAPGYDPLTGVRPGLRLRARLAGCMRSGRGWGSAVARGRSSGSGPLAEAARTETALTDRRIHRHRRHLEAPARRLAGGHAADEDLAAARAAHAAGGLRRTRAASRSG